MGTLRNHLADAVCLSLEDHHSFQHVLDHLLAVHSPANPHERSCIERLALAELRFLRAVAQETALLELALAQSAPALDAKFQSLDVPTRIAAAESYYSSSKNSPLESIRRQQGRLRRESESALRQLLLLQKQRTQKSREIASNLGEIRNHD